ncbi:MAG: BrxA family protein, partial [Myxococcota bacterium]
MAGARSSVVSSFTIVKGSLIDETYSVFRGWDFSKSRRDNLASVRNDNSIGAKSANWARDVAKVINRRFDPSGRDRPLVELALAGCARDVWDPLLLFHMTRDEFLLRDFLVNW